MEQRMEQRMEHSMEEAAYMEQRMEQRMEEAAYMKQRMEHSRPGFRVLWFRFQVYGAQSARVQGFVV